MRLIVFVAAALVTCGASLAAHHSAVQFDFANSKAVTGPATSKYFHENAGVRAGAKVSGLRVPLRFGAKYQTANASNTCRKARTSAR